MGETTETNKLVKDINKLPYSYAHETPNSGRIRNGRVVSKAKTPGMSDINWAYYGLNIKLETKLKNGVQSDAQSTFQQNVHANGGLYYIVESFDHILNIITWLHAQDWFIVYAKMRYNALFTNNNSNDA